MLHLWVKSWSIDDKSWRMDDVISWVEKLDPTIRDRWKSESELDGGKKKFYDLIDDVKSLLEEAKMPKGFWFEWINEECFAITAPVGSPPVPEVVKQYFPDEDYGPDSFGEVYQD